MAKNIFSNCLTLEEIDAKLETLKADEIDAFNEGDLDAQELSEVIETLTDAANSAYLELSISGVFNEVSSEGELYV